MKSKIILFSMFLFSIISVQAQPGCATTTFDPFDNYYYVDVDNIVYGSAFDSENLNTWAKLTGNNLRFSISSTKLKIKVIENLKGKTSER